MHVDVRALLFSSLAFALLSGCSAHLRPKLEVATGTKEKLKLRAALVVPQAMEKKSDDIGSFDGLGAFTVDTSDSVLPAVKEVLKNTFEAVDVVRAVDLAPNADVVLVLKTMKVVHPSGRSSDFQLRFDLRATVLKQDGVQVIDAAYNEPIDGQKKAAAQEALGAPSEKTMMATLARLESDLRLALGPPPSELPPAEALAAADAGVPGDFSDYPPAPVAVAPAPVVVAEAGADAGTPVDAIDAGVTVVAEAPAPAPAPAPEPVVAVVEAPPPPPAPKSKAGRVVLGTMGALLFAGGYAAPPLTMMLLNQPFATNELAWVPLAGPLLSLMTNPFLSQDLQAMILTVAGTAGQVVGLALMVAAIASGGSSTGPPKKAALAIEGKGWALTPVISPGGVGLVLVH